MMNYTALEGCLRELDTPNLKNILRPFGQHPNHPSSSSRFLTDFHAARLGFFLSKPIKVLWQGFSPWYAKTKKRILGFTTTGKNDQRLLFETELNREKCILGFSAPKNLSSGLGLPKRWHLIIDTSWLYSKGLFLDKALKQQRLLGMQD